MAMRSSSIAEKAKNIHMHLSLLANFINISIAKLLRFQEKSDTASHTYSLTFVGLNKFKRLAECIFLLLHKAVFEHPRKLEQFSGC